MMETNDVQLAKLSWYLLLLLQLHKTNPTIQSVCWAKNTLLISVVMSTAQWRNERFEIGGEQSLAEGGLLATLGPLANTQKKSLRNDSESGVK